MIVLTGCASAEEVQTPPEQERVAATASPVVGTWRWSGSGHRIGEIELGEEELVFRDDGTYAVVSKSGDGSSSECYEGTFTFATAAEPGHGTVVFRSAHVRDTANGFEREVFLDADGVLHFGDGGMYRRTSAAVGLRCP